MLDQKIIMSGIKKMLDIIYAQGYEWGKIEIDFDSRTRRIKIQVHQFYKNGNESVRRTATISNQ